MNQYPQEFKIVMGFLFIIEIFTGGGLNMFVIFRRLNTKLSRQSMDGRNFIAALQYIDLIISVTAIPMAFLVLVLDVEHTRVPCLLKESIVMLASSGSSVCVMMISIDRYFAIVMPTKRFFTNRRVAVCKIFICAFAFIGFLLPYSTLTKETPDTNLKDVPCRFVLWTILPYYIYEIYYIIAFLTTLVFVLLSYGSVLKVVWQRTETRLNAASTSSDIVNERVRQRDVKATRVTYSVVITFLICWVPHVVVTILQISKPDNNYIDIIQIVCLFVAFLTIIIHPIIYSQSDTTTLDLPMFKFSRITSRNKIVPGTIETPGNPGRSSVNRQCTSVSFVGSSVLFQINSSSSKSSGSNEQSTMNVESTTT